MTARSAAASLSSRACLDMRRWWWSRSSSAPSTPSYP